MSNSIIKQKSYDFALRVIKLCSYLKQKGHYELTSQLIRAGTSIGANVEEALAGQRKKDFYAKMCIASKEARETNYWLRLIQDSKFVKTERISDLLCASEEIIRILTSIVKTGYKSQNKITQNLKLKT
jgi:four helix bundle protein